MKATLGILLPVAMMVSFTVLLTGWVLVLLHNPEASTLEVATELATQPRETFKRGVPVLPDPPESSPTPAPLLASTVLVLAGFVGMVWFSIRHHGDVMRFSEREVEAAIADEPRPPKMAGKRKALSRGARRRKRQARQREREQALQIATRVSRISKNVSFLMFMGGGLFGILFWLSERVW